MKVRHVVPATGVALVVAATVLPASASADAAPALEPRKVDRVVVKAVGTFELPAKADRAFTYDSRAVPVGARAMVRSVSANGRNDVTLGVRGLLPGRIYDAHVHVKPCAADPAASAGHYKHVPEGPADPENEIWLNFRTDDRGKASAHATHAWTFPADRRPNSVVIHSPVQPDGTQPRLACITVPFAS